MVFFESKESERHTVAIICEYILSCNGNVYRGTIFHVSSRLDNNIVLMLLCSIILCVLQQKVYQ